MKKILASLLVTSLLTIASGVAFAGRTSGCGPGAVLLKGNSGLISNVSAYSTNTTFNSFITYSMTSGTSGCNSRDRVMNNMDDEIFVRDNYPLILTEVSQGQGEFASTYVGMLKCSDENEALVKLQKNPSLLETNNYQEFVVASKSILDDNCQG